MTPEEILEQAQTAAKAAKDKLSLRAPNSKIGFLRRRDDGSTTLRILNPSNDGVGKSRGDVRTSFSSYFLLFNPFYAEHRFKSRKCIRPETGVEKSYSDK